MAQLANVSILTTNFSLLIPNYDLIPPLFLVLHPVHGVLEYLAAQAWELHDNAGFDGKIAWEEILESAIDFALILLNAQAKTEANSQIIGERNAATYGWVQQKSSMGSCIDAESVTHVDRDIGRPFFLGKVHSTIHKNGNKRHFAWPIAMQSDTEAHREELIDLIACDQVATE